MKIGKSYDLIREFWELTVRVANPAEKSLLSEHLHDCRLGMKVLSHAEGVLELGVLGQSNGEVPWIDEHDGTSVLKLLEPADDPLPIQRYIKSEELAGRGPVSKTEDGLLDVISQLHRMTFNADGHKDVSDATIHLLTSGGSI